MGGHPRRVAAPTGASVEGVATTLSSLLNPSPTPMITYYDVSTGERIELSGVTLVNWVSKVANLLVDDLDAERGTRLRIGLPSHWLRYVWLLGAWRIGAVVTDANADIGLSGPELQADEPVRLAASLRPMGARFAQEPQGFLDTAIHVAGSPDVFVDVDPPEPDDVALDLAGVVSTQADLLATAAQSDRLLIEPQALGDDARLLVATLLGGGSLVVMAHGDEDARVRIAEQERARVEPSA